MAGLYRGVLPSLLLVAQGSMQLMAYEALTSVSRDLILPPRDVQGGADLSSLHVGAIGACSKLFATFFTYPMQVVRTRLQKRQEHDSAGAGKGNKSAAARAPTTIGTLRSLYGEGLRGFYRGMVPNLMRTMPQSAITFAVYEKILRLVRTQTL